LILHFATGFDGLSKSDCKSVLGSSFLVLGLKTDGGAFSPRRQKLKSVDQELFFSTVSEASPLRRTASLQNTCLQNAIHHPTTAPPSSFEPRTKHEEPGTYCLLFR
jgi:hypothetical protein